MHTKSYETQTLTLVRLTRRGERGIATKAGHCVSPHPASPYLPPDRVQTARHNEPTIRSVRLIESPIIVAASAKSVNYYKHGSLNSCRSWMTFFRYRATNWNWCVEVIKSQSTRSNLSSHYLSDFFFLYIYIQGCNIVDFRVIFLWI